MPNASGKNSDQNMRHAMDLVFFEQWLRFYFISEEDGKLFLRMPEKEFEHSKTMHPDLFPIAVALNDREIDHQTALSALCDSMISGPYALDGQAWAQVLAGDRFRLVLQLLSFWVQAEEEKLDEQVLSFAQWRDNFMLWSEQPSIKDYVARLRMADSESPDFSTKIQ